MSANPLQLVPSNVKSFTAEQWEFRKREHLAKAEARREHSKNAALAIDTAKGQDYFSNSAARMGWGTNSLAEATEYDLVRLSYNWWLLITLYRNHWICRRIVDYPAQDMVKAWARLTSDIDPKQLTKVDHALRRTGTKAHILKALKWARLFGGSGAVIVIDGQESVMDEPLDLDSIEVGSFRGIIPFDRWCGITPGNEISTDINNPLGFNLPSYYEVRSPRGDTSFRIHESRVLRFNGPTVPSPELEAQMYWGISVLEPAYEEIRKRDNMSWNILSMTFRANIISMVNPELAQMLSGASISQQGLIGFEQRMRAMNSLMSNQSLMILPKDGQMGSTSYAFSGMDGIYAQFQMDIAGAANMPVTRLFGRTLSGLGQSNDADERIYEELISIEQGDNLLPQLEKLYPVILMSEIGEVPKDLDIIFPSVRILDDKDKADLAGAVGKNILDALSAGVIDKPTAMKEFKQSSDVTGLFTNITDEMIEEAEEEQELLKKAGLPQPGQEHEEQPGAGERPAGEREPKEPRPRGDSLDSWGASVFAGIPITFVSAANERRTLRNDDGDIVYDRLLQHDYGFINDTTGRDGDEIDCIIGPNEGADKVYVIDMLDLVQGPQDNEDKCFLGFDDADEAKAAFYAMYPETFFGGIETMSLDDFREKWLQFDSAANDSWTESAHPRGNPDNPGQFAKKGAGGASGQMSQPGANRHGEMVRESFGRWNEAKWCRWIRGMAKIKA